MGVNRRNNTRTLQKNLKKNNKRSLRSQKGGVIPGTGRLGGLRVSQNRTIRNPTGSLSTFASQGRTTKDTSQMVEKDNAGRGFLRRTEDQFRDSFGSDDPRNQSTFGKYGLRTAFGKRAGSDQGRFGQEYYDSGKQLDENRDKAKNKKAFNKRQARQYGLNIAVLFDTAQKYMADNDDNELMEMAEKYLSTIMNDAVANTGINYVPGNYKRNLGELTRVLPDYKAEFQINDSETYEQHKAKVQSLLEKNYRTIETAIKNYEEKIKQDYINNENQKYVGYPTLQKYKFLEDLDFQTQIMERGKEYTKLNPIEINKRFDSEVFKLGIYTEEQKDQYLSRCNKADGEKYSRSSYESKGKGLKHGKCIAANSDELANIVTPWIFGEIVHIFDQFEYVCKQTDRAMKNNVDCGHRFRVNKRKADNEKEKEYGFNKDYLARLENYVSIGGYEGQELHVGDIIIHTDLTKGIRNKVGIVATPKDKSKLGKYKVAYLNRDQLYTKKKQLERKRVELFKLRNKLNAINSQSKGNTSIMGSSKAAFDKMKTEYIKSKEEYDKIYKLGDFERDRNGDIIQRTLEATNLTSIGRIQLRDTGSNSDYNPKYANFVIRQLKLFGLEPYEYNDATNEDIDIELDRFSYATDKGFYKGKKISDEQNRIEQEGKQFAELDAELVGSTTQGVPATNVASAANQLSLTNVQGPVPAGPAGTTFNTIAGQGGGAGGLVWKNSDGTTAPSFNEWITKNITTRKTLYKLNDNTLREIFNDDPREPYTGPDRYFVDQTARTTYMSRRVNRSGIQFQAASPGSFSSRADKGLDRRKQHFEELCPQDLGCELIELFSIINPKLLSFEELEDVVLTTDNEEDLKVIAEEYNCQRDKIMEASVAKPGSPAIIQGAKKLNPMDALRALILSPIDQGGAQVVSQDERKAYILAYLELRDLPKIYITLRDKLKKINNSSEAIKKIDEIKRKYENNSEGSYMKQLPEPPPISQDRFGEDSKLMYLLKELILFDLEQKYKKTDEKKDLKLQNFKTKQEIIDKIKEIDSKYVGIFNSVEEQKLIPEFTSGTGTLKEQSKETLFDLLLRVISEKEFSTSVSIQIENVRKSVLSYLYDNVLIDKWMKKYVGSPGSWKLDIDDLKPLNIDVMALSCKASTEDYLMRIPHTIINAYIREDYGLEFWTKVCTEESDETGEIKDRAVKINKFVDTYDRFRKDNNLGDDQDRYIYETVRRITKDQTPTNRDKLIETGAKSVSLPNGTLFYVKNDEDYNTLSKISKLHMASQKITKLMRKQLITGLAINKRKEIELHYRDDMNILKYDIFVRDYQKKVKGQGAYDNLLNSFNPEDCSFTITDCDIDQFNGEYYYQDNNTFFKLDTSGGKYNFYMKKMNIGDGIHTFGIHDVMSIPEYKNEHTVIFQSIRKKEETNYMASLNKDPSGANRWCLCVTLKDTEFRKKTPTVSGTYIYYSCMGDPINDSDDINASTYQIPKDKSSYNYKKVGKKKIRIPKSSSGWMITPLGGKLLEYQDLGLQIGWPTYPYCSVSTPEVDDGGFFRNLGVGLGNLTLGLISVIEEMVSAGLGLTGAIVGGLLAYFGGGAVFAAGMITLGASAVITAAKMALKNNVTSDDNSNELTDEQKDKNSENVPIFRAGKTASRSYLLSSKQKSNQSLGLSKYLVSPQTMVRISNLGLKIRFTSDENKLYQLAGQCPSGKNCSEDSQDTSGMWEKIKFFKHPSKARFPTLRGKNVDGGVWWNKEAEGIKQIYNNKGIQNNVDRLLKDALKSNNGKSDIHNKILYAIGPDNSYDDEGTRILNNSVSEFIRVNADPDRLSTRGGIDRLSINRIPNFFSGTVSAFTKEECENPRLLNSNKRLYDLGGGSKKEAIDWILRPENVFSLVSIANDMYQHDTKIGGDATGRLESLGSSKHFVFFGEEKGPIWAKSKYGWDRDGTNKKSEPGKHWKQLNITSGEGRKNLTESSEREHGRETNTVRRTKQTFDKTKFGPIDFTETNIQRYNKFNEKGSQFYLKEAARKGIMDNKGRPIARLLNENNPHILEAINKTWARGKPGGVGEDLSLPERENKDKEGEYTQIKDIELMDFQNDKVLKSVGLGAQRRFSFGKDKDYIKYLPGPLLLEIYYDKYPFNRYYKTNMDGTVDLKWAGHNLHGVWIDPRGQEIIASTFTPSIKTAIQNPEKKYNELTSDEKNIALEFSDFQSEMAQITKEPPKNQSEADKENLFKYRPTISKEKKYLTLCLNKIQSNSSIPIFNVTGTDDMIVEFTLGPIVNSRRSYIDINQKLAIVWFNEFDKLKLSIANVNPSPMIINYASSAGWAIVNMGHNISEKSANGEILFYAHQPAYRLNSKEGFHCCSSENIPSRENWIYLETTGNRNATDSSSNNFDYIIDRDLFGGLKNSMKDKNNIVQGSIGGLRQGGVSRYLTNRGLTNYGVSKIYKIISSQKDYEEQSNINNTFIPILGSEELYVERLDYQSNLSSSFSFYTPYLYGKYSATKADFVNNNLSQWIRGICRANPSVLGSVKEGDTEAGWMRNDKVRINSTGDKSWIERETAWNRSKECYSFTAWAYANNYQIGATIRLSDDVINYAPNNILQQQLSLTDEDIFMVIGYNGYWNSYGICDKVGPPKSNTVQRKYLLAKTVSWTLRALGAIAVLALVATDFVATGGDVTSAVADSGMIDTAAEVGGEHGAEFQQLATDAAASGDDVTNEIGSALLTDNPDELVSAAQEITDNAGGTISSELAESLANWDMLDSIEYSLYDMFDIVGDNPEALKFATELDGWQESLLVGLPVVTAGLAAVHGVSSVVEKSLEYTEDAIVWTGDQLDKLKDKTTDINSRSELERLYGSDNSNSFETNFNVLNDYTSYSDKIPFPSRLGYSSSASTTQYDLKKGLPPQLFYYYKTGDESMPARLVNGVEIYLQRLTNVTEDNRFVTISVPFSGDLTDPLDKLAETSEGIYDIRKGWQIPTVIKSDSLPYLGMQALERAVMGVKNRIKNKLIPHYDINEVRKLFVNIDENSKNIQEQLNNYEGIIERYADVKISDCKTHDTNINPLKLEQKDQLKIINKKNTVDEELCEIISKYDTNENYSTDGIVIVHEDKKIILKILQALTSRILSGRYKEYNPRSDMWVEKESVPECDEALMAIENNRKENDNSSSNDRIDFGNYKCILNTLQGYKGYTIKDKYETVEWFSIMKEQIHLLEYFDNESEISNMKDKLDKLDKYSDNISNIHNNNRTKIKMISTLTSIYEDIFKLICVRINERDPNSRQIGNENKQYSTKISLNDKEVCFKRSDNMENIMKKLDKEFPGNNHLAKFKVAHNLLMPLVDKQGGNYPLSFDNYLLNETDINNYRVDTIHDPKYSNSKPDLGNIIQNILISLIPIDEETDFVISREKMRLDNLIITNKFIISLLNYRIISVPDDINRDIFIKYLGDDNRGEINKIIVKLKQILPNVARADLGNEDKVNQILNGIFGEGDAVDRNILLCLLILAQNSEENQEIHINNMLTHRVLTKILITKMELKTNLKVYRYDSNVDINDENMDGLTIDDLNKEYDSENEMEDKKGEYIKYGDNNRINLFNSHILRKKISLFNMTSIKKVSEGKYDLSDVVGFRDKFIEWFIYGDITKDYQTLIEINEKLAWESINYVNSYSVYEEIERLEINNAKINALMKKYPSLKKIKSKLMAFTVNSNYKQYFDSIKNSDRQLIEYFKNEGHKQLLSSETLKKKDTPEQQLKKDLDTSPGRLANKYRNQADKADKELLSGGGRTIRIKKGNRNRNKRTAKR